MLKSLSLCNKVLSSLSLSVSVSLFVSVSLSRSTPLAPFVVEILIEQAKKKKKKKNAAAADMKFHIFYVLTESKLTWCLTSTETVRLIRDGEKGGGGGGKGYGGGGGGKGRLYTCRYAVTTRMIPALRWAAMRAILIVSVGSDGQSHKTVSTNHNLCEVESRSGIEPRSFRLPA